MPWPWKRRATELSAANVAADWIERQAWLSWDAPRNYIAGESSYSAALRQIAGPVCKDGYCFAVPVTLVREPHNRYDTNAVRAEVQGHLIGYLRRHLAAQLAGPLDGARCSAFLVPGVVRGGSTTAKNLGCHIWLDRRLGPGPEISLPPDPEWAVPWPPEDRAALTAAHG